MVIFLCSQCCDVWRYVCAVSLQCATVLWMCHSWCVVKYSGVCCMQFLCSFIPGEDNWVWTPSALQSNKFACTQMWSTFMYQCLPAINVYQGNRITSTAEDTRIVFSAFHHAVTAVQCAILTHPIMLLNGCLTPPLTTISIVWIQRKQHCVERVVRYQTFSKEEAFLRKIAPSCWVLDRGNKAITKIAVSQSRT